MKRREVARVLFDARPAPYEHRQRMEQWRNVVLDFAAHFNNQSGADIDEFLELCGAS